MVRVQIRRDAASNWTTNNPTLLAGEYGLETNTGKVKLGDGVTAWNSLSYFNALSGLKDVTITSLQSGQVLNWNGSAWVNVTPSSGVTDHTLLSNIGSNTHSQIDTFIGTKGAANGLAPLGADSKIATTYLPSSVIGALEYKGAYDCSVGTYPSDPETGWYYICSVLGTISAVPYSVGDWMVYNGTGWDKIDNTDAVTSVAGMTGVVTLNTSNVSENASYLYFTDERAQDAVGGMFTDTNSVDFTYTDASATVSADVKVNSASLEITGSGVGVKSGVFVPFPAGSAQGDLLYHNGTTFTRLAAGTNGQVLITKGSGQNPIYSGIDGGDSIG